MSLQDNVPAPRKQDQQVDKTPTSQAVADASLIKAPRKRKLSSHKHDNVIMFAQRRCDSASLTQHQKKRKTQMKKTNAATQTAPEAPQAQAGITLTPEQFQQLLERATSAHSGMPQRQPKRSPFSTRRPREVIMLSFQCDRELAEELDKVAAELHMRGEATSKRATYERVFKEGMKALRTSK